MVLHRTLQVEPIYQSLPLHARGHPSQRLTTRCRPSGPRSEPASATPKFAADNTGMSGNRYRLPTVRPPPESVSLTTRSRAWRSCMVCMSSRRYTLSTHPFRTTSPLATRSAGISLNGRETPSEAGGAALYGFDTPRRYCLGGPIFC